MIPRDLYRDVRRVALDSGDKEVGLTVLWCDPTDPEACDPADVLRLAGALTNFMVRQIECAEDREEISELATASWESVAEISGLLTRLAASVRPGPQPAIERENAALRAALSEFVPEARHATTEDLDAVHETLTNPEMPLAPSELLCTCDGGARSEADSHAASCPYTGSLLAALVSR